MARSRADRPRTTVVITGIGLATGLGPDRESSWSGIRCGRSALKVLTDARNPGSVMIGAPLGYFSGPSSELALGLARKALEDAGISSESPLLRERGGVVV